LNWIKKNKAQLIFTLVLFVIFFGFYFLPETEGKFYSYISLYLGVLIFISTLPEKKWLKPIVLLIQLPAELIFLLAPFMQAFLMVMILSIFSFGILALILKQGPELILNIDLNFAAKFYLLLITGSILLTLFGNKAVPYFNSVINSSRTEQREESQLKLTLALVNKEKIIFLLYMGYFLYLIPYSISVLSNHNVFEIENLDRSIFNAFITYTAFERILANKDRLKIDYKGLRNKVFDTWK
jgi:hypothetical protein